MNNAIAETLLEYLLKKSSLNQLLARIKDSLKLDEICLLKEKDGRLLSNDKSIEEKTVNTNGKNVILHNEFFIKKWKNKNNQTSYAIYGVNNELVGMISILRSNFDLKIDNTMKLVCQIVSTKEFQSDTHNKKQNDELKTMFLSKLNHELRTPLSGIIGVIELLKSRGVSEDYLKILDKSATALQMTINNLLSFNGGNKEDSDDQLSIKGVVCCLESQFQEDLEKKNIKVDRRLLNESQLFYTYKDDLHAILSGLFSNAIKFSKEDSTIEIAAGIDKNILCIEIKDFGIGISDTKRNNLFKEFDQEDNNYTRNYSGLGIGLSVINKLLKERNGTISVSSEKDKGSIFSITFPIKQKRETFSFNNQGFGDILLVEDDKSIQEITKFYLNKLGFNIDIADNGKMGLEFALKKDYHIILMDLQMPVMDGFESSLKIKENKKHQKIITVTAHNFQEEKEKVFKCGIDGFLSKPVKLEDLALTIQDHMSFLFRIKEKNINLEEFVSLHKTIEEGIEYFKNNMLKTFLKTVDEDIVVIEKLIQKNDTQQLSKCFHKLKSTFGTFGLKSSQLRFAEWQKSDSFSYETLNELKLRYASDKIYLEKWLKEKSKEK